MASSLQVQTTLLRESIVRLWQEAVYMTLTERKFEEALKNKGIVDQGKRVTFRLPNHFKILKDSEFSSDSGESTERLEEVQIDKNANSRQDFNTDEIQFETAHDFEERFVAPITGDIGMSIEAILAKELFRGSHYHIGTAGSQPASFEAISDTMSFMNRLAIPTNKRALVFHEKTRTQIMKYAGFQNSFEASRTASVNKRSMMGETCMFDLYSSPLTHEQVAGTGDWTLAPGATETGYVGCGDVELVPGAGTNVLSIQNLPLTAEVDVLRVGDKIKIAGRYLYSYAHKKVLNDVEAQYTILPDPSNITGYYDIANEYYKTIDTSGDMEVLVDPPFNGLDTVVATEYANIDKQPQIGDAIWLVTANTLTGSTVKIPYKCNMGFVPTALLFAAPIMVGLEKEANVRSNAVFAREMGMNFGMMHYSQGDIKTTIPSVIHRYRVQYGFRVLGEYSVVLLG